VAWGFAEQQYVDADAMAVLAEQAAKFIPQMNLPSLASFVSCYTRLHVRSESLVEAIAIASALKLGAWRKISQAQNQLLTQQYRAAIKTIGDNLANMNLRTGKGWSKDTRDNPRWRP
jgi:hypothetical protein